MGITNATYTSPDWAYYKYPLSIAPIPDPMQPGIIALCTFALASCMATISLLGFLTYRFIVSRNESRAPLYKNQYMLLIYSLVLADFQCDLGFFLDVMWMYRGEIAAPSAGCYIQAWLINFGDLSSALFVLAIACHTFSNVVFGHKIMLRNLCIAIAFLWIFAAIITVSPIAMHPKDIFVASGNWCSIGTKYDSLRLYFHYLWIFIVQGMVLIIYMTTFIVLRKRIGTIMPQLAQRSTTTSGNETMAGQQNTKKSSKISRATMYMVFYPLIYIIATLPLAAGRISAMVGNTPSKAYLVAGGIIMSCGGLLNVLLYSFTRRIFISEKQTSAQDRRRSRYGGGRGSVLRSTDPGGFELKEPVSPYREIPSPVESTDHIVSSEFEGNSDITIAKDVVTIRTTWDVKIEQVKDAEKVLY
ncbi:hypothetical protein G7Y89_g8862 [Cudoniella acicularis]|uniref:G-protein coupled receptors family 1 profile domain-containing protein n=1 Tax=Cudoniella acicularis TaxID=354080 RepID=A0A8H4RIM2_9HELO|nr:hypothetical protein G7Y89_g8862 [Cudoniella acicularis]